MKVAVLSGKGGTGKTLVSVNLASVAGYAAYVDCDVEEPNGHLFFGRPFRKKNQSWSEAPESTMTFAADAGSVWNFAGSMPWLMWGASC